MTSLDGALLVGAVVLIAAIIAARLGARLGLPALLLFLALGMVLGDSGIGIQFDDADLAHALGFAALVIILAEGGITTRWADIKPSFGMATLLATAGTLTSIALMATFAYFVLGLGLWTAVLLGAVCSPTDSAAVFSVLRKVPLPHRVRGTLEAESGLNDAPTVLLVVAASELALGQSPAGGALGLSLMVVLELLGGGALGLALGWLGVNLLKRVALPSSGLYPLAALSWAVMSYGLAATLHTSGFASVYVCALMLGNGGLPHRAATRSFVEGMGWIAQIGLFVMLGMLARPDRITWSSVGIAVVAGLFLTLVARPVSIFIATVWFKIPLREQAFLSWAGLRGAVPIVLTTIPLADGVDRADVLFDIVLVLVVIFTFVQGPTLPWVARILGLGEGEQVDADIESAPLDRASADLLQVRIPEGSHLHGVRVGELRLPPNVAISLVIRHGRMFAPHGRDVLRNGDEILIVTPSHVREIVNDRLRAVGRRGRLARWHRRGEDEI